MTKSNSEILANAYTAFVPMDRRHAIHNKTPLPEQQYGAAMLADIAGFSALSDLLREIHDSKRAAEELTLYLNRVFTSWIGQIHNHGGSVISFSGDAVTCWFAEDNGSSATNCALSLLPAISSILPGKKDDQIKPLKVKVAVVVGTSHRYLVGDPAERCIEMLAGEIPHRLGQILDAANAGEVLISEEIQKTCGHQLTTAAAKSLKDEKAFPVTSITGVSPQPWPDLPQIPAEQSRAWVLPRVTERLAAAGDEFLAEIRPLTVMFIRVIDTGDEQAADYGLIVDEYIRWIQKTIARYEGELLELSGGDKGNYFYLTFGATVAHADDPQRAVAAALELRNPPDSLKIGHKIKIGISHGEMCVGAYGSKSRRCFGVQGHEANIGAHLMSLAEVNCILTTKRVAESCSSHFTFLPAGQFSVKGIEISVHKAQAKIHTPIKSTAQFPMVGRQEEWIHCVKALDRLANNQGGTVLVEAQAGYGKSRLLNEVIEEVSERGLRVLNGSADPIEQNAPMHAWRQILRQLLGISDHASGPDAHNIAISAINDLSLDMELLPLLNLPLLINAPETRTTEPLAGKQRKDSTVKYVIDILHGFNSNSSPMVLVFEDAQWMDPLSLAVCHQLNQNNSNILIIISTREIKSGTTLIEIRDNANTAHIQLESLKTAATRELVSRKLGVSDISDKLAEFIFRKTDGHPLFSEELTYALRDANLITLSDGKFDILPRVDNLDTITFTDTLQNAVTSRLDRLDSQHQFILKIASVIGRQFLHTTLHDTWTKGAGGGDMQSILRNLEQLNITPLAQSLPVPMYMFRHTLTRDVVYDQMLLSQRGRLHRLVAEWFEVFYSDDLQPHCQILAHHWSSAAQANEDDTEAAASAVKYLRQTAAQSSNIGAPLDAVRTGLQAASFLQLNLPIEPADVQQAIGIEENQINKYLQNISLDQLESLPELSDDKVAEQINVLLEIMPAAFMGRLGELFALLGVTSMRLTLQHGLGGAAPVVFSMYAILRRNMYQDAVSAHQFSSNALELDQLQGNYTYSVVTFIHTWFIDLWLRPLRESLDLVLKAGNHGLTQGDVRYGSFCLSGHVLYSAASGLPLDKVEHTARAQLHAIDNRVLSSVFHCLLELQFAKAMDGRTENPLSLNDDEYQEQEHIASIQETDQYNQIAYYHIARLKLHYFQHDYIGAIASGNIGFDLLPAAGGQVAEMELRFFYALAALGMQRSKPDPDLMQRAGEELSIINQWKSLCVANFEHKHDLISAEIASIEGDDSLAADMYVKAASSAAEHGYLQHKALAHELAARHFTALNKHNDAINSYKQAEKGYHQWGATTKADEMARNVAKTPPSKTKSN